MIGSIVLRIEQSRCRWCPGGASRIRTDSILLARQAFFRWNYDPGCRLPQLVEQGFQILLIGGVDRFPR